LEIAINDTLFNQMTAQLHRQIEKPAANIGLVIVAVQCPADPAHAIWLKAPPSKSFKTSVKMPSTRKKRKRASFFAIFVKFSQYDCLFVVCGTFSASGNKEYAPNGCLLLLKAALSQQTQYPRDS